MALSAVSSLRIEEDLSRVLFYPTSHMPSHVRRKESTLTSYGVEAYVQLLQVDRDLRVARWLQSQTAVTHYPCVTALVRSFNNQLTILRLKHSWRYEGISILRDDHQKREPMDPTQLPIGS
jgi:hypothetical protein